MSLVQPITPQTRPHKPKAQILEIIIGDYTKEFSPEKKTQVKKILNHYLEKEKYEKAAKFAEKFEIYNIATHLYEKAKKYNLAAKIYKEKLNNTSWAIRCYRICKNYEKAGDLISEQSPEKAIIYYLKANNIKKAEDIILNNNTLKKYKTLDNYLDKNKSTPETNQNNTKDLEESLQEKNQTYNEMKVAKTIEYHNKKITFPKKIKYKPTEKHKNKNTQSKTNFHVISPPHNSTAYPLMKLPDSNPNVPYLFK